MLIDTNIFIEIPKEQTYHKDCLNLLKLVDSGYIQEEVFITGFAFHAMEAILSEFAPDFLKKIFLMIHEEKIKIFNTEIADDLMILSSMDALGFDFDDAMQYVCTNKLGTYIVTFDKSFRDKGLIIKTPAEVLKELLA